MKKIFISLLFLLSLHIQGSSQYEVEKIRALIAADELKENCYPTRNIIKVKSICVSLGYNCLVALNFRNNNIREWAFPFDWNLTSLAGLCNLINNDFVDFLNPQYFDRRAGIYNTKYNLAFAHDFPTIRQKDGTDTEVANYLDYLDDITKKYERQIERFQNVCELAETVYFFRLGSYWRWDKAPQTKESIIRLRDTLISKFPRKNWTLVAIDTNPSYKNNWKIPMIKNFYISDHGKVVEWKNIFKKLGLLS